MFGFSTLSRRSQNMLLALLAAGLALNCFPVALLPSLDFLFGGIAVLVVVHIYGATWGVVAALVASSYTLHLWQHPYGLLIFGLEALFVGALRRKSHNILLLDGLFWLLVGMPLVWLIYTHALLDVPPTTVRLVVVKDAVNGIFNALAASLLVMYRPLQRPQLPPVRPRRTPNQSPSAIVGAIVEEVPFSGRLSLSQMIFNLSVGCALLPPLLLTVMSSRRARDKIEDDLQFGLREQSAALSRTAGRWHARHLDSARDLAALTAQANLRPSLGLRHDIALSVASFSDLSAIRLVTSDTSTAQPHAVNFKETALYLRSGTPRIPVPQNQTAQNQTAAARAAQNAATWRNLSKARAPFFASVTAGDAKSNATRSDTTKSQFANGNIANGAENAIALSSATSGRNTPPVLYAPIRRNDVLRGFLEITVDPSVLQTILSRALANTAPTDELAPNASHTNAVASNAVASNAVASNAVASNAVASNAVAVRAVLVDGGGRVVAGRVADDAFVPGRRERASGFANGVYRWLPVEARMPNVERARRSVFVREQRLEGLPWTLLVSSPLEPRMRSLQEASFENLLVMLLLSIASLVLAQVLSTSLTRPLSRLADVTTDLPLKLIGPEKSENLAWPDSPMEELHVLVRNFKAMSGTLQDNFRQIQNARRRLEEEQKQLQEANRLKDEFLAILSHELRTPLVPIIGYADLIMRGVLGPEEVNDAAQAIERNARVQLRLIEDLLDVSRIISGKMRLEIGAVQLESLVHDAIDAIHVVAQTKNIRVTLRAQEGLPLFQADSARLKQVMWNLLNNAIKFTPEGGRVEVTLERMAKGAQISVVDSGQGISSEFLPFVFDRFRQAANHLTRAQGGLGLGLAIVRHLVEAHGGLIEARSEGIGQGTAFIVTLPFQAPVQEPAQNTPASTPLSSSAAHMSTHAAADIVKTETQPVMQAQVQVDAAQSIEARIAEDQAQTRQATNDAAANGTAVDDVMTDNAVVGNVVVGNAVVGNAVVESAAGDNAAFEMASHLAEHSQHEDLNRGVGRLRGARVLVVDDEPDNRGLLSAIIQLEGGAVIIASSGGEGLRLAQSQKPTVIVSDLGMPVMDGYEFLQNLRAVESLKNVPVIAFTGYADGRDRVRSLQNGFNAYLSKPAQADDVIDVIESLSERHGE